MQSISDFPVCFYVLLTSRQLTAKYIFSIYSIIWGAPMKANISIELSDKESDALKTVAAQKGCSPASLLKQLVLDKLSDEDERLLLMKYELDKSSLKSRVIESLLKELGI